MSPAPLLVAFSLLFAFQDKPVTPPQDDLAQVHIKMHKKIAPSVVYVRGGNRNSQSAGSGVIISKDGVIVTSTSAVGAKSETARVLLAGHKEIEAKILGRVDDKELVVLKIDAKDLAAVELGDSDAVKLGQICYTFGDCYNSIAIDDQVSMSLGVISAMYEITKKNGNRSAYLGKVLETSAAVNPNQNGGALIDATGHLLGLITLNYQESKFTGIVVPINVLKPEIDRILGGGAVAVEKKETGWFGVDVDEGDDLPGVRVTRVVKNSPAEKAGLKIGDLILKIDAARTMTERRFTEVISKLTVGSILKIKIERSGQESEVTVTLEKRPEY